MTDDDFESRRTIQRVIRVLRTSKADPRARLHVIACSIAALAIAALIGIGIPWIFFRTEVAPTSSTAPIARCPDVTSAVTLAHEPARVPVELADRSIEVMAIDPAPAPIVEAAARSKPRAKPSKPRVVVMLVDPFR